MLSPRSQHTLSRSSSSAPYVPHPENLILPDGAIGEEATELLNDLVHRNHRYENDENSGQTRGRGLGDDTGPGDPKQFKRPWWKTPSPWWLFTVVPFTAIAMSATIAPRIEIYTTLACIAHKPDIFEQNSTDIDYGNIGKPRFEHNPNVVLTPVSANEPFTHNIIFGRDHLNIAKGYQQNSTQPNRCASDPVVQAAVAKLTAAILMLTCAGILSCLTTGFWGSLSDRKGRTRVMGISILGLLVTDFNFIFVTSFYRRVPGGYWFLILGPIIEGFLGGSATGVATMHAYIADTTSEETRSRTFSLSLGLLFIGIALGPTIGGLLIHYTGKTLSVFYMASCLHIIYALFVWFILPESLTKSRMQKSVMIYNDELRDIASHRATNPAVGLVIRLKRLFSFLSPLAIFIPNVGERSGNPLKRKGSDWSLTLVAVAYGFTISVMASFPFKFQYAASTFGWTSETLGYWLSLVGSVRAVFLTIILPLTIKLFKPTPMIIQIPVEPTESEPLLSPTRTNFDPASSQSQPRRTIEKKIHSPAFDLGLARFSLAIDVIGYAFMAFATSSLAFALFGVIGSMGAGFSPAIQSVALTLYTKRGGTESGKLFGALSVIQALSSNIIGPAVYGLVYMKTVGTYPRAIFFVTLAAVFISLILLGFVRLPKDTHTDTLFTDVEEVDAERPGEPLAREGTLVDVDTPGGRQ